MEVYIDDMLVKSADTHEHIRDLEEDFGTLQRYQMKLNPTKCTFGVTVKIFFSFLMSQ